ncbi:hypothetical protein C9374_007026 [Naegleria lovaniensis]|uniref:COMM domain-containing protein 1 n=1 Tax=Naegleria lovaniensis TaxID=51637 RepID=A0AA88H2H6_NAELO|nr:uncharacterized protein C9374_007026 [Naegleria lovaniensis]KAG2393495.1 hypothetical protein C9374_007026 [Naegleria lovaniensis]
MFSGEHHAPSDEADSSLNTASEEESTTTFVIDAKYLFALLKGLNQIMFEKDDLMTESMMNQQVFGNEILSEEQNNFVNRCKQLIRLASYKNWTPTQLKEHLLSDDDAKRVFNTNDLVQTWVKFWTQFSSRIHQQLVNESKEDFGNNLTDMKWRIDQKTNINRLSEISESVAVVQLSTKQDPNHPLLFEMDKDTLKSVMEQFKVIQKRIDQLS